MLDNDYFFSRIGIFLLHFPQLPLDFTLLLQHLLPFALHPFPLLCELLDVLLPLPFLLLYLLNLLQVQLLDLLQLLSLLLLPSHQLLGLPLDLGQLLGLAARHFRILCAHPA